MKAAALALVFGLAAPAVAAEAPLSFRFPVPARITGQEATGLGSYALPVGPYRAGAVKTLAVEGPVTITAWRLDKRGLSTMGLLADLRAQLEAAGYVPLFSCATHECGGFDFRYGMRLLPEPQMHVDLGDFRYLAAKHVGADGAAPDYIALMISRSQDAGFVEAIRVGGGAPAAQVAAPVATVAAVPGTGEPLASTADIGAALEDSGAAVLGGLNFGSGSSDLAAGSYPSLAALAAYLASHPDRKVTLVGHTDAEGALAANIALSKKRASSVMQRLIDDYGVDPGQISAEGVGYLAPVASNLTEAGREENRRVEAVLDSTQ